MSPGPLDRVAVALDTDDPRVFKDWCDTFGPLVGILKVGLQAFTALGPRAVDEAAESGARVFLDLKLHDIPNTVAGAVRAAWRAGASYATVHAGGGRSMLEAATAAAGDRLSILAVTVLTHLDPSALRELGLSGTPEEVAGAWAELATAAGCQGIVCSPREVAELRERLPPGTVLATPGIRFGPVAGDDQERVAGPAEAVRAGADILVVGRPLTRAPDPLEALDLLAGALAGAPDASLG